MRNEIYNCLQARWLPYVIGEEQPIPQTEELMNVLNFTNYDIVYMLVEDTKPIKRMVIYPFKCHKISRIKPHQHAILSVYDTPSIWIKVDRKLIKNKLIVLTSSINPYRYAPGVLGWIEKTYINHIIPKSELLFFN